MTRTHVKSQDIGTKLIKSLDETQKVLDDLGPRRRLGAYEEYRQLWPERLDAFVTPMLDKKSLARTRLPGQATLYRAADPRSGIRLAHVAEGLHSASSDELAFHTVGASDHEKTISLTAGKLLLATQFSEATMGRLLSSGQNLRITKGTMISAAIGVICKRFDKSRDGTASSQTTARLLAYLERIVRSAPEMPYFPIEFIAEKMHFTAYEVAAVLCDAEALKALLDATPDRYPETVLLPETVGKSTLDANMSLAALAINSPHHQSCTKRLDATLRVFYTFMFERIKRCDKEQQTELLNEIIRKSAVPYHCIRALRVMLDCADEAKIFNRAHLGQILIGAAQFGWVEGVEYLIELQADLDQRRALTRGAVNRLCRGRTALHMAAMLDDVEPENKATRLVSILLKAGANPGSVCNEGPEINSDPLFLACSVGNRHAARLILEAQTQTQRRESDWQSAIKKFISFVPELKDFKERVTLCETVEGVVELCQEYGGDIADILVSNKVFDQMEDLLPLVSLCVISTLACLTNPMVRLDNFLAGDEPLKKRLCDAICAYVDRLVSVRVPARPLELYAKSKLNIDDVITRIAMDRRLVLEQLAHSLTLGNIGAAKIYLDEQVPLTVYDIVQSFFLLMNKSNNTKLDASLRKSYEALSPSFFGHKSVAHYYPEVLNLAIMFKDYSVIKMILGLGRRPELGAVSWHQAGPSAMTPLHRAVSVGPKMTETVLGALSLGERQAWLCARDAQGDTPLHVAARLGVAACRPFLKLGPETLRDAMNGVNEMGRSVALEALSAGQVDAFAQWARLSEAGSSTDVLIHALTSTHGALTAEALSAVAKAPGGAQLLVRAAPRLFDRLCVLGDKAGLELVAKRYPEVVRPAPEGTANSLHLLAQRGQQESVKALLRALGGPEVLAQLASQRDEEGRLPEACALDTAMRAQLHGLRQQAKKASPEQASAPGRPTWPKALDAAFKDLQALTRRVVDAQASPSQEERAKAFLGAAQALQRKAAGPQGTSFINRCAWQVLEALSRGTASAGMGVHWQAHLPHQADEFLLARATRLNKVGSTSFGPQDGLAILRLRAEALQQGARHYTQQRLRAEGDEQQQAVVASLPFIHEGQDDSLSGRGYVLDPKQGSYGRKERLTKIRFIMGAQKDGVRMVTAYPN